ncbi:MAG: hypothetical protein WCX31_01990 [Salinivirgaceae bacterium]|jgi:hypothetical protein
MENNFNDKQGERYEEITKYLIAENVIENSQSAPGYPPPTVPTKSVPGKPDIESDPTRIEPGINEPTKNDPTRKDKLPPTFDTK